MTRLSNGGKVPQYDVLRVITTLLVVISHGNYNILETPYGGIDYTALIPAGSTVWALLGDITQFVNSFTMPVFMALGGALFYRSMKKGKFTSLGALARDKAARLLLPFVAVTLLYSFPIKLATGYFRGSDNVVLDLLVGQLLIQGNTHLWYLPAMFFDFLICYLLETRVKLPRLLKLAVLAVISVVLWSSSNWIWMIAYPLRFAVWFYAGYCFEQLRPRLDRFGSIGWGLLCCVAAGVIYVASRRLFGTTGVGGVAQLIGRRLLLPMAAGLGLYFLSCGLAKTRLMNTGVFNLLSRNSFGIYLYSDPVNYILLAVGAAVCGLFLFGGGVGTLVLYALRIGVTLCVSLLVSELLRRCKVKYVV